MHPACFIASIPHLRRASRLHASHPHHRHHHHDHHQYPHHRCIPPPRTAPRATDMAPPQQSPSLPSRQPPPQHLSPHVRVLRALWPFSRPHTVYGTLLSVVSLTVLSVQLSPTTASAALGALITALPPALLTNLYIVGLNQLHDVDLDRVNKPHLPLASGALTPREARFVVLFALLAALACLACASTPPLIIAVVASAALGTAYSAPPLRLKRFPACAGAAIMAVRGLVVNVCFFRHAAPALSTLPPLVRFAVAFFTVFGAVIALLKDVPDIPGDRKFGIRTFSVRLGPTRVFVACVVLLVAIFLFAAAVYARFAILAALTRNATGFVALAYPAVAACTAAALLHLLVAAWLFVRARGVDVTSRDSVTRYYMDSWKVFYLEYLLLPLAAL